MAIRWASRALAASLIAWVFAAMVVGQVRVRGRVNLEFFYDRSDRYPVRLEFRPVNGDPPERYNVTLTWWDGGFDVETALRTPMDVWVKAPHWLAQRIDGYDPLVQDELLFSLTNGDITDDNVVDLDDFLVLAAAYETMPGDGAWNEMADVDGDWTVRLNDFMILAAFYEFHGMP